MDADKLCMDAENKTRRPLACYFVGGLLLCFLVAAIAFGIAMHLGWPEIFCRSGLLKAHGMCAIFGMIGATLAAMRKYYQALITEETDATKGQPSEKINWGWGWQYYYVTRPLLGAILGALSFTLSYVGIQILAKPSDIQLSNHGRYLLFGLALVSGFSVSHVLNRLNSVAKQVFKASSSKR